MVVLMAWSLAWAVHPCTLSTQPFMHFVSTHARAEVAARGPARPARTHPFAHTPPQKNEDRCNVISQLPVDQKLFINAYAAVYDGACAEGGGMP